MMAEVAARKEKLAALEKSIVSNCENVNGLTSSIFTVCIVLTLFRPDPTLSVCLFGFYGTRALPANAHGSFPPLPPPRARTRTLPNNGRHARALPRLGRHLLVLPARDGRCRPRVALPVLASSSAHVRHAHADLQEGAGAPARPPARAQSPRTRPSEPGRVLRRSPCC